MVRATPETSEDDNQAEDETAAEILARQPDDPGANAAVDTDDLAMRLDSLLGDKPKK